MFVDVPGNSSRSEVEKLIFVYDDIATQEEMKKGKGASFEAVKMQIYFDWAAIK